MSGDPSGNTAAVKNSPNARLGDAASAITINSLQPL